jgi:chaperone modulatory protein CbpM
VAQGVIEVRGLTPARWHFDEEALGRLLRARRLERDLGLNAAGIALALELTEEVRRLRRHLRVLRTEAEPLHEQD